MRHASSGVPFSRTSYVIALQLQEQPKRPMTVDSHHGAAYASARG